MTPLEQFDALPTFSIDDWGYYKVDSEGLYRPTLTKYEDISDYRISWVNSIDHTTLFLTREIYMFNGKIAERAIDKAHNWCLENNLKYD